MENKVSVVKKVVEKKPVPAKEILSKKVIPVKEFPIKKEIKPVPRQTKIEVSSVQDILKIVGSKDFFEIYELAKKENPEFFSKGFTGTFENKEEVKEFFKEKVLDLLKEKYGDCRSLITELRKGGSDVGDLDLKSLSIPLKMRVLKINFKINEFNNLYSRASFVGTSLKKIKDEKIEKEEELNLIQKKKRVQKSKVVKQPVEIKNKKLN